VIGAATTSDPIPGTEAVINTKTEDLRERVWELTAGTGVDDVLDAAGGPMFEPALRSLRHGGRQVAISSTGDPRAVSTSLTFSQFLPTAGSGQFWIDVATGRRSPTSFALVLKRGSCKRPLIEIVPFGEAVDAYQRLATGQAKTKLVFSFDWRKNG
jgi:NADPH:quinone reductase-like Zn-dependent oxidoreductase